MAPVLPVTLTMLRDKHPGVHIEVQFIGNEAMKTGLDNFSLDVAITYMDSPELGRRNSLQIFTERLCLMAPAHKQYASMESISWKEAAELPLALLNSTMHERSRIDKAFAAAGVTPKPRVESESILHLMFQTQYTELCTIIPEHFTVMPGLHKGTRAISLVEPVLTQKIGLYWAEGETIMPMAAAIVGIIETLNRTGELRTRLGDTSPIDVKQRVKIHAPTKEMLDTSRIRIR